MLYIEISELIDSHVNIRSVEQFSGTQSEVARTPLSDNRSDYESLNAESIAGLAPGNQGLDPSDVRGVASIYPLSDGGYKSESLDVDNGIV